MSRVEVWYEVWRSPWGRYHVRRRETLLGVAFLAQSVASAWSYRRAVEKALAAPA
jgi:hypothetical protein